MRRAIIVRPVLESLPLTYRDPKAYRRPQLTLRLHLRVPSLDTPHPVGCPYV